MPPNNKQNKLQAQPDCMNCFC